MDFWQNNGNLNKFLRNINSCIIKKLIHRYYRGADKSLARPGRKQAKETEDFDVHVFYL
jgi:hypothetical protein